jgi:glyoxylase-like metal-dependent hydrolase (beta-lactamase superfamily II)
LEDRFVIAPSDIRRLYLGHYTMPPDSSLPGQKIVACAYLLRLPTGYVLFDTGIGTGHDQAEREFGPIVRRPVRDALAEHGLAPSDITAVANCHLHLDHCGENSLFPATPLFVQRAELDALPTLDYVLAEVVDFDGVTLEVHDGDAAVAPGVQIVPTPGHTPGHQSLLIETTQGKILLAGQAMGMASDLNRAMFSLSLPETEQPDGQAAIPEWVHHLLELDVRVALFAHDLAVWDRYAFRDLTHA